MIKTILLSVATGALLTTVATAAPINATPLGASANAAVEQVRMVCDQSGRCWRSRGPRYVQRGYGDDGYVRRGYDRPGYGYYGGGGPSIGLSFGNRGW
jgi:hypothetical protein